MCQIFGNDVIKHCGPLLPPSAVDCPLWQIQLRIYILIGSLSVCVVLRAPDSAPLKSKMIYASSKDAIKKKLTGELSCDLLSC